MKERIRWIDNAKGICVFCVLLAHCKLHHPYIQMVYTSQAEKKLLIVNDAAHGESYHKEKKLVQSNITHFLEKYVD